MTRRFVKSRKLHGSQGKALFNFLYSIFFDYSIFFIMAFSVTQTQPFFYIYFVAKIVENSVFWSEYRNTGATIDKIIRNAYIILSTYHAFL